MKESRPIHRKDVIADHFVIIAKSQVIDFVGNCTLQKIAERKESSLSFPHIQFDYLVNVGDHNFSILPEDLSTFKEVLIVIKAGEPTSFRVRIVNADGLFYELRAEGQMGEKSSGNVSHSVKLESEEDIEKRLFEYSEKFASSGSWRWNIETNDIRFTLNIYRIFDIRPGEAISWEKLLPYVHISDRSKVEQFPELLQHPGDSEILEFRILRGNDKIVRYLKAKAETLNTDNGKRFCIGTIQDITNEKLSEEKLRQQEILVSARLNEKESKLKSQEELLKEAEIVGQIGSYEGRIATMTFSFSDNMFRLLGYKPNAFKPTLDFVDSISVKEDAIEVRRIIEEAISRKKPYEYTRRIIMHNGQVRHIHSKGKVILDSKGNVERVLGIAQDVTHREINELMLQQIEEERKRADKELQEKSHFINSVLETIPDMLAVVEVETGAVEYYNSGPYKERGFDSDTVFHLPATDLRKFVHPDDMPNLHGYFKRFLDLDTHVNSVEFRGMSGDKGWKWFRIRGKVFRRNEDGKVTHCLNVIQDIDDYKKSVEEVIRMKGSVDAGLQTTALSQETSRLLEEINVQLEGMVKERTVQLQESKDLLQKTLDAIPHMIWVSDSNKKFLLFNDRWSHYTGLQDDNMNNVLVPEIPIFHSSQEKELRSILEKTFEGDVPYRGEVLVRNKDGHHRWHLLSVIPVQNNKGTVELWVGSFTNVHLQFINEKRLKQNKDLLLAVLNASQSSIAVLESVFNSENKIVDFNIGLTNTAAQNVARNKGSIRESLLQKFPGMIPSGLFDKLKDVMSSGVTIRFEQFYDYDGIKGWFDFSAVRLEDLMVVTFQDITKRKESEMEFQAANEMLRHKNHQLKTINEELKTFAFVASHDLREPIRKIRVFTSMLTERADANLPEFAKKSIDRIMSSINRMSALVEDIVVYSQAVVGSRYVVRKDLNDIISSLLIEMKPLIQSKQAVIEWSPLPFVECDPNQVNQLFLNIISNALKFQKEGTVPRLTISATLVEGKTIEHPMALMQLRYWKIDFADNGIGIEKEYGEQIFQMFQRLHQKFEYSGTGIGLAIAKKVIENHNGFITLEGIPEGGSIFSCYFPATND